MIFALAATIAEEAAVVAAADLTPFSVWNEEARAASPIWVQRWIIFMLCTFFAGLFFVRTQIAARWIVASVVVSHLASALVLLLLGPAALTVGVIAINHIVFWTPAALNLAVRGAPTSDAPLYGAWRYLMLVVIAFSLFFDFRDAAIFLFSNPG